MSWEKDLASTLLPVGLGIVGGKLRDRDKDDKGADDAWGQVCSIMAPVAPDLVSGAPGANATLKAMRALEKVAHAYRMSVGDTADVGSL
jgi:hypothetical protein